MDDALGPGYDYWKSIKSPSELGMSGNPSISTLANNVSGLLSYVSVLVTGDSDASKTGDPLGNKFFLKTMASCRNIMADRKLPDSEKNPITVPRYIYVDNIPDGTIPFISSGPDGTKLSDFRGLIPGAVGNLAAFSPSGFGRAFTMGNYPDCMPIALKTVNNDNNHGVETHYVAVADIMHEIKRDNMVNGNPVGGVSDPCRFKDYTNPATGAKGTKEKCNPEDQTDKFSLLHEPTNIGYLSDSSSSSSDSDSSLSSDSSSSSDSGSSSDSSSDAHPNNKQNKQKKQKKQKKDKKKDQKKKDQKKDNAYTPSNKPAIKYDNMNIDNDTMFDDVLLDPGVVQTDHAFMLPTDTASRIYYVAVAGIGLYLFYRLLKKYNREK